MMLSLGLESGAIVLVIVEGPETTYVCGAACTCTTRTKLEQDSTVQEHTILIWKLVEALLKTNGGSQQ